MQKEKNPENATKLWSNLAGVTGSHIDALAAQDGMHDKLNSWFTDLTNPPIVQTILNYTQARRPPQPDPRRQRTKTPAIPALKSAQALGCCMRTCFCRAGPCCSPCVTRTYVHC